MSKKLRKLTNIDLEGSIPHLMYELDMLKEISILLSTNSFDGDKTEQNALVESFVIHARGLIDFLYYERKKDDDVMAYNYFQHEEWEKIAGIEDRARISDYMPKILRDTRERVHKEVAHITTFRIGKKLVDKKWQHGKITLEIYKIFKLFFVHAPKEYIAERIGRKFLSNYNTIINRPVTMNNYAADTSRRST